MPVKSRIMGQKLNDMLSRVTRNKSDEKVTAEEEFYYNHDLLCSEYGWVPLEEYCKLPKQTVIIMIEQIIKRRKREAEMHKKAAKGKGKGIRR